MKWNGITWTEIAEVEGGHFPIVHTDVQYSLLVVYVWVCVFRGVLSRGVYFGNRIRGGGE